MTDDPPKRRRRRGDVHKATAAELQDLGLDPARSAAAAAALRLATELDSAIDPKEAAAAARELRQAMAVVRGLATPQEEGDAVDDLTARRDARRQA